uniref:Uncharacterized protein n=1 Tax=Anguilla anguilla TaxID=7936 RepID=A0A0E9PDZ2_ANGAN
MRDSARHIKVNFLMCDLVTTVPLSINLLPGLFWEEKRVDGENEKEC